MEFEIKLAADAGEIPLEIADDVLIKGVMLSDWYETPMHTIYYDNEAGILRSGHYTLRHRMEGSRSVVTCKTPTGVAGLRGEYELDAPDIQTGIPLLVQAGAPRILLMLVEPVPVCGAKFLRRACRLKLETCECELAIDKGILYKSECILPFTELELELKSGDAKSMLALAETLKRSYHLHVEEKSKFARAIRL